MPRFEGLESIDADAFFSKFRDDAYGSLWDDGEDKETEKKSEPPAP